MTKMNVFSVFIFILVIYLCIHNVNAYQSIPEDETTTFLNFFTESLIQSTSSCEPQKCKWYEDFHPADCACQVHQDVVFFEMKINGTTLQLWDGSEAPNFPRNLTHEYVFPSRSSQEWVNVSSIIVTQVYPESAASSCGVMLYGKVELAAQWTTKKLAGVCSGSPGICTVNLQGFPGDLTTIEEGTWADFKLFKIRPYCEISSKEVLGQSVHIPIQQHLSAWCPSENTSNITQICNCTRPNWGQVPITMDNGGMAVSPDCRKNINFGFLALGSGPSFWDEKHFSVIEGQNDEPNINLTTGFTPFDALKDIYPQNVFYLTLLTSETEVKSWDDDETWDGFKMNISLYKKIDDGVYTPVNSNRKELSGDQLKNYFTLQTNSIPYYQWQATSLSNFFDAFEITDRDLIGIAGFQIQTRLARDNDIWYSPLITFPKQTAVDCKILGQSIENMGTLFPDDNGICNGCPAGLRGENCDELEMLGTLTFIPPVDFNESNLTSSRIFTLQNHLTETLRDSLNNFNITTYGTGISIPDDAVQFRRLRVSYANSPTKRRVHVTFGIANINIENNNDGGGDGDTPGQNPSGNTNGEEGMMSILQTTNSLYDLWTELQKNQGQVGKDDGYDQNEQYTPVLGQPEGAEDLYDPKCTGTTCAPNPLDGETFVDDAICFSYLCKQQPPTPPLSPKAKLNIAIIAVVIIIVIIGAFVGISIGVYCCKKHQKACWAIPKSKQQNKTKRIEASSSYESSRASVHGNTNISMTSITKSQSGSNTSNHFSTTITSQVEVEDKLLDDTPWKAYRDGQDKIFYVNQSTLQSTWVHPITGVNANGATSW